MLVKRGVLHHHGRRHGGDSSIFFVCFELQSEYADGFPQPSSSIKGYQNPNHFCRRGPPKRWAPTIIIDGAITPITGLINGYLVLFQPYKRS